MIKNLIKFFFVLTIVVLPNWGRVSAAILDNAYLLTTAVISNIGGTNTTKPVALEGIVYPLTEGQNVSGAQLYFKTQEVGGIMTVQHQNFSPLASGDFNYTIPSLNCGSTYKFWLYESPNSLISVDTVDGDGSLAYAFQMPIICSNQQSSQPDDQMAPQSAGAEAIAGVNWGDMNVTDHSINISNAYIIPISYGGSKTFKIEYGTGTGNNNGQPQNGNFLGFSSNITKNPPYNFSFQVGALIPNTNYYLNLWEVTLDADGNELATNLFVYTYTLTNQSTNNAGINFTFPSSTSMHVYGNLLNDSGMALEGLPVRIELHSALDTDSAIVQSFDTVVSGNDLINGNGFYEHTFSGLTADTAYFVVLRQINSGAVLMGPLEAITPSGNTTQVIPPNNATPTYDGLIACGGPDCDFNALISTINRVINFLIVFVAFPAVAIVVAWAGLMLILSGGNSSKKEYAKSILGKILIGFIVAILCWAIIKYILILLGYVPTGPLWSILGTTPTN